MYFVAGASTALAPVMFKNKEIQTEADPDRNKEGLSFIVIRQQIEQQVIEVEKIQDKHKSMLDKYESLKIEGYQPSYKQNNNNNDSLGEYELKLDDLEEFVKEFQQFQEGYRSQKLLYKRTSENYFNNNSVPKPKKKGEKFREDYLKESMMSE